MIGLGVLPPDPQHWFREWCMGEADYHQVHQARENDPIFHWRTVERANPSVKHLPALEADLRDVREKARRNPDRRDEWRARDISTWASRTGAGGCSCPSRTGPALEAVKPPASWPLRASGGIDPGGSSAFTALACYSVLTGALAGFQAVGGVPTLAGSSARTDGVGKRLRGHAPRRIAGRAGRPPPPLSGAIHPRRAQPLREAPG